VAEACEQEGRMGFRFARLGLPPDHPTLVGFPGTDYLSGIVIEAS
jgi:23S rRNA (cytosine1962-C5)-methyltransferase